MTGIRDWYVPEKCDLGAEIHIEMCPGKKDKTSNSGERNIASLYGYGIFSTLECRVRQIVRKSSAKRQLWDEVALKLANLLGYYMQLFFNNTVTSMEKPYS